MKSPTDTLLILGATMRLTHLITNDDLGQWWVKDPLDAWVHGHPQLTPREDPQAVPVLPAPMPRRLRYHRYLAGLSCPHCVGTWIGAGVLASYALASRRPAALRAWRAVAASLSLNTATVAAGDAIKYWD